MALAYKSLWQVERAFREMKSSLKLCPIYHWSESRVRGAHHGLLSGPRSRIGIDALHEERM
ncbi:MAG: hypothetical protein H5T92_02275 [Synergistales bacterium]|nr:hypothetical protein [Synergistales bacterium]